MAKCYWCDEDAVYEVRYKFIGQMSHPIGSPSKSWIWEPLNLCGEHFRQWRDKHLGPDDITAICNTGAMLDRLEALEAAAKEVIPLLIDAQLEMLEASKMYSYYRQYTDEIKAIDRLRNLVGKVTK